MSADGNGFQLFRQSACPPICPAGIFCFVLVCGILRSGILLWPAGFVLPNALRAANDVKFTMMTSILSMMIWRLGFSYVLCVQMGMGAVGVWIAMVVDWVCRVTCFVARFVSGAWKKRCTPVRTA